MHFLERIKQYFVPSEQNAYRPGVLGRKSLLFFLGLILAAEGFLVANLVGRHGADFLAAVIGSEIISLTNTERQEAAAPELTPNALLQAAAERKAKDMATRSYFSHVGPDGKLPWAWVAEAGYEYSLAGENLAVRFVDSSDVVEAWMASPTHKANIVKPAYAEIGVGVAQGEYKGSSATFVVQFFGTPRAAVATPVSTTPTEENSSIASALGEETQPEVAGESVNAPPVAVSSLVSHPPTLTESLMRTFARIFAEPRATTAVLLGSVVVVLIIVVALAFFIHIQIQPVDLLVRGSLVAAFALFLVLLNEQVLTAPAMFQNQAAAVVESTSNFKVEGGVVISDSGVSTEYFIVEQ